MQKLPWITENMKLDEVMVSKSFYTIIKNTVTKWLKQYLFPTVLEAGKSKIKVPAALLSGYN